VSEAVGGAEQLQVASRAASARPGPGAAATRQENLPYGGWIRQDGSSAEAWLETGDAYTFTPAASIRAVEETLGGSPHGALSPAAAFGADFAFTIQDTKRIGPPDLESSAKSVE
jgi:hypothetical protein